MTNLGPITPWRGRRVRSYSRKRILAAAAALVLVLAGATMIISRLFTASAGVPGTGEAAPSSGEDGSESAPVWETRITIPSGATLAGLLENRDFTNGEIHRLKEAVKPVYDLAKIKAGQDLRIARTLDGDWTSMEYTIDESRFLTIRNVSGAIRAEISEFPFVFKPALVQGTIEESLYMALQAAGEKDSLALDLEERCFGWDVDFWTDVRRGDAFKILVEKKYLEGNFLGYGNILAAEFTNEGKTFRAFRFVYPDTGLADYFDEDGNSKRTEFLKSPLKGGRITSRFTSSRLHPIYKIYRPHYGVDYGAPIGTPVQATGDGRVNFAGWNGESGRMIRIQHKNSYETLYLHLRGFAPGIRKGVQVRGGEVIGYVGSSGGSTGPHLDYRVRYHGSYINPLGIKFKPADPLRPEFREAYRPEVEKYRFLLDAPRIINATRAAASSSGF